MKENITKEIERLLKLMQDEKEVEALRTYALTIESLIVSHTRL